MRVWRWKSTWGRVELALLLDILTPAERLWPFLCKFTFTTCGKLTDRKPLSVFVLWSSQKDWLPMVFVYCSHPWVNARHIWSPTSQRACNNAEGLVGPRSKPIIEIGPPLWLLAVQTLPCWQSFTFASSSACFQAMCHLPVQVPDTMVQENTICSFADSVTQNRKLHLLSCSYLSNSCR